MSPLVAALPDVHRDGERAGPQDRRRAAPCAVRGRLAHDLHRDHRRDLAGIALGAWIGGRAADIVGPLPLLGPAFILGGLSAIAAVPIVGMIGGVGLGEGLVAIVLLATTAFVVPAAIVSATAPMLVRGTLTDLATSGSIRRPALGSRDGRRHHGHVPDGLRPARTLSRPAS